MGKHPVISVDAPSLALLLKTGFNDHTKYDRKACCAGLGPDEISFMVSEALVFLSEMENRQLCVEVIKFSDPSRLKVEDFFVKVRIKIVLAFSVSIGGNLEYGCWVNLADFRSDVDTSLSCHLKEGVTLEVSKKLQSAEDVIRNTKKMM